MYHLLVREPAEIAAHHRHDREIARLHHATEATSSPNRLVLQHEDFHPEETNDHDLLPDVDQDHPRHGLEVQSDAVEISHLLVRLAAIVLRGSTEQDLLRDDNILLQETSADTDHGQDLPEEPTMTTTGADDLPLHEQSLVGRLVGRHHQFIPIESVSQVLHHAHLIVSPHLVSREMVISSLQLVQLVMATTVHLHPVLHARSVLAKLRRPVLQGFVHLHPVHVHLVTDSTVPDETSIRHFGARPA